MHFHLVSFFCISEAIAAGAIANTMSKLNCSPHKKGTSTALSLLVIVSNAQKLDTKLLPLKFGAHVEAYEDFSYETNSLNTLNVSAIILNLKFNPTVVIIFLL